MREVRRTGGGMVTSGERGESPTWLKQSGRKGQVRGARSLLRDTDLPRRTLALVGRLSGGRECDLDRVPQAASGSPWLVLTRFLTRFRAAA
jgi:hypothetical protein